LLTNYVLALSVITNIPRMKAANGECFIAALVHH